MSHSYKDLLVWQKARSLAVSVFRATDAFPKREWYGLAAQLRRAAVSVASNIAEGQGRATKRDFLHFLAVSRGSLLEVQTQLAIELDLAFVDQAAYHKLENDSAEVLRMLNALMDSLRPESEVAHV